MALSPAANGTNRPRFDLANYSNDDPGSPTASFTSPSLHAGNASPPPTTTSYPADGVQYPGSIANDDLGSPTASFTSSPSHTGNASPPPTTTSCPADGVHSSGNIATASLPLADPASRLRDAADTLLSAGPSHLTRPPLRAQNAATSLGRREEPEDEPIHRVVFAEFVAVNVAARHLFSLIELQQGQKTSTQNSLIERGPEGPLYRLAIDSKLSIWTIGTSSKSTILLCPNGLGAAEARQSIAKDHASIIFHPDSGVLVIKSLSDQQIICNGKNSIIRGSVKEGEQYSNTYAFCNRHCPLKIGPYHFELRFMKLSPSEHADFLLLRRMHIGLHSDSFPLCYLEPFPSADKADTNVGVKNDLSLRKRISSSTWSAVAQSSGRAFVVKMVRHRLTMHEDWHRQQRVVRLINQNSLKMADVKAFMWTERESFYELKISIPMATFNFRVFLAQGPESKLSPNQVILYLAQTFNGLSNLNRCHLTHGNITPDTLLVYRSTTNSLEYQVLISPIIVSSEIIGSQSSIFIAPELSDVLGCYSEKSDIWSLAMSWVSCITGFMRVPFGSVSQQDVEDALGMLTNDGRIGSSFVALIRMMLALDPRDRLAYDEVACHEAWGDRNTEGKRKEADREQSADSGVQKGQDGNRARKRPRTTKRVSFK